MSKIIYPKELVKYIPQESYGKLAKDAVIYALDPSKTPISYLEILNGLAIPIFDTSFNQENPCMFGVPQELAIPMGKKGRGKGRNRKEKYKLIYEHKSDATISDELIKYACDVTRDSAPIFAKARPDETVYTWRADYKGSAYYMYQQGQRIIEAAKDLAEEYKYCYFLTTTYDTKLFDGDREIAFDFFIKEQQKFIKASKRKFKTEIIKVMEVTNRGYPHAHMLIFSNEPLGRFGQKEKKSQIIKQGRFYNFAKAKCTLGRIQLKTVENDGVHKYISKYIAKANFDAEAKGQTKKKKMSASARKARMSAIFPSVFGYRAFSCTWSKKKKEFKEFIQATKEKVVSFVSGAKACLVNNSNTCNSSLKDAPEGGNRSGIPSLVGDSLEAILDGLSKAKRSLASLISFSIKENKGCAGMLRRLAVAPKKTLNKKIFGTNTLDDFCNLVDGNAYQTCVSCCGCPFISKILEFAKHPEEEWAEMLPSPLVNLTDEQNREVTVYDEWGTYTPKYIRWGDAERRLSGVKIFDSDLEPKYQALKKRCGEEERGLVSEAIWEELQSVRKEQMNRNFLRDTWVLAGYTEEDFRKYYVG